MFSDILKELRDDYHDSQADLATKLGVAKSTVSNWEQNKSQPNYGLLCRICDLYNVSSDYLLGRTRDDPFQQKRRLNALTEENQLFVKKIEKLLLLDQQQQAEK